MFEFMKNIKLWIFKILFSLSSFSWFLLFTAIMQNRNIPYIKIPKFLYFIPINYRIIIKPIIYLIFIILFTLLLVLCFKRFIKTNDQISNIIKISPLEWDLIPIYLWLFVISLSFWTDCSLYQWIIAIILLIFRVNFETISYFNPFMMLLWYRFYKVETNNWIIVTIISKTKDVKTVNNISFSKLKRLNNFTFFDSWDEKNNS